MHRASTSIVIYIQHGQLCLYGGHDDSHSLLLVSSFNDFTSMAIKYVPTFPVRSHTKADVNVTECIRGKYQFVV